MKQELNRQIEARLAEKEAEKQLEAVKKSVAGDNLRKRKSWNAKKSRTVRSRKCRTGEPSCK